MKLYGLTMFLKRQQVGMAVCTHVHWKGGDIITDVLTIESTTTVRNHKGQKR